MSPPQSTSETLLQSLTDITQDNLENEQFGVSELAREMGMSRSNLHRKVKSVTGKSVSQFIRQVRLNKAMELLKDSSYTVSEVAYRVGFGSATYFNKCFHDYFGFPPGEAENRSNTVSPPSQSQSTFSVPGRKKSRIPVPWIITSTMVIVVIIILIITYKPFSGQNPPVNKTIVVLPFHNDSPDKGDDYIINSLMEEIINKLTFIEDLSVVSRTTSEVYRDSDKSLKEIGAELQADYILEGSATIINNNTRIRLQLIDPVTDSHLWSKPYEREITLENIFQVQEEVAFAVSDELKVVLKPEEKKLIERQPTENLEAYDAYMRAMELQYILSLRGGQDYDLKILQSKQFLNQAITFDSTFSDAYTQLAGIYINQDYYSEIVQDKERAYAYLDTGLFFVEKALSSYESDSKYTKSLNSQYSFALLLKGTYFQRIGMHEKAEWFLQEYWKYTNRPYLIYRSNVYWYISSNNYYSVVANYLKYEELRPKDQIVPFWIHQSMCLAFSGAGFPELARQHSEQWLLLDRDSISHFWRMISMERQQGNYLEAIRYIRILSDLDPDYQWYFNNLSSYHICLDDFETAARLTLQGIDRLEQQGVEIEPNCIIGYVYQKLGEKEMAEYHLKGDISRLTRSLEYPTKGTQLGYTHIHIARVYSMLGDIEKSLEYLAYLKNLPCIDISLINQMKDLPYFDLVREIPEFKEILTHMETVYKKEHKRIVRLLKQNGMIAR